LDIINSAFEAQPLPVYEQLGYRITDSLSHLSSGISASTEEKVEQLLRNDVLPVLKHIQTNVPNCEYLVDNYLDKIKPGNKTFHKNRDEFDETISRINSCMAGFIDLKQVEAQKLFPHYFDRYKTDGVEHNMFIGQSIVKDRNFNEVVLQNLRLWQITVMCEMENRFYEIQETKKFQIEFKVTNFSF